MERAADGVDGPGPIAALIAAHEPRIRRALRNARLQRWGIDADDVAQEVRVRLWRALARETVVDPPASYVEQAIRTAVIDAVRRAAARPAAADATGIPEHIPDPGPEPSAAAAGTALIADARRILAGMTRKRATAVGLLLAGYTIPEIARMTRTTEASARNLAYRALAELRLRLAERGHDAEL